MREPWSPASADVGSADHPAPRPRACLSRMIRSPSLASLDVCTRLPCSWCSVRVFSWVELLKLAVYVG